ncbi:nucleoside transporter [Pseudomaricurvus alkylphenolicus]|uniref:purine-cytosine permease family protein n=1 Tax=Pseudomaricurvus alkylphenolicus TaxID=1306991 RepID=UPI00141E09FB|nr:nucleoside transporter [Pseudomaricurvus alkylphenolicus]NIB43416.1 nucleoside transporter [Pseudomaricurvus alkylphenolicus]
MSDHHEFEMAPVAPEQLQPARYFAASYAGEHVAGTEFVIGAMFVAWGVGTGDILWGLLLGNLMAVLTWGLVCAPIATETRLTLYAYLYRICGGHLVKLYSVANGVLFCILAGAMITVSASAVRILFDIPAQVTWYPTSVGFVAVALAVGAVVVAIATQGFARVAQFAEVCAPWMILMFIAGALAMYPQLYQVASVSGDDTGFIAIADRYIWIEGDTGIGFWHVAAFAWICNLAMHGGMSDMTVLRFACKARYGYFSVLGMFIGHYMAWICAGVMGAGAALMLKSNITQLDAGAVAFQALGASGIIAVIIAGWTTSNPTIYRAGLAFQSLNPNWSRTKVTALAGVVTTIIACFPFVFSKLMDFVGLMGLILVPVGAVIVTEHWLFRPLGLTRYWSHYRGQSLNMAALLSWLASLATAWLLNQHLHVHLFFLLLPVWATTTLLYLALAAAFGARKYYGRAAANLEAAEHERQQAEKRYLNEKKGEISSEKGTYSLAGVAAMLSLLTCAGATAYVYNNGDLERFKFWLLLPTISYFISAAIWMIKREPGSANESEVVSAL